MVMLEHSADPHIFTHDHVILPNERQGCCMLEVAPLVADMLMRLGE